MAKGARILLIDDDEGFRLLVRRMLGPAGYEVQEANDGRAGLILYRQRPADLVITDLLMPDREGLETIRELRRADPRARIIALSAADKAYLAIALKFGARRVLQKPFTRDELLTAVTETLAV